MKNVKENLLSNIVLLRCFAILVVVLGHSMIIYSDNWSIFQARNQSVFFSIVKKYIDIFQMPLFIFVSGYVYSFVKLERHKYKDFIPFLKNKFKRLIIPFVCVAVFYVLPIRKLVHYEPYEGQSFLTFLFENVLLGKDTGHLWYLPTIFFIFLIFYLIENRVLRKSPYLINLLVLGILSCVCSLLPDILYIKFVTQYLLFFYLGYLIRDLLKDRERKKERTNITYVLIMILFLLQFVGLVFNNLLSEYASQPVYSLIITVGQRVGSVCSILFFYFLFVKINDVFPRLSENKYINFVDKESFPIYLFHSPIIYIMLFFLADKDINPFVLISINFIVCTLGSILISKGIQKTNKLNFIIGK